MIASNHIRNRLISGLFVLVPAGISLIVLSLLYRATIGFVSRMVRPIFAESPGYVITLIAIGLVVSILYIVGSLTTNVFGRRLITWTEDLLGRMPLVNSVYGAARKVVGVFRSESDTTARSIALVPFPNPHTWCMGFVTGEVETPNTGRMVSVFIPTTPNPTTGFLQLFPSDAIQRLDIDMDDAFSFIMSAGVICPEQFTANSKPRG